MLGLTLLVVPLLQSVASSKIVPPYEPALLPDARGWSASSSSASSTNTKRYIEIPISKPSGELSGLSNLRKRASITAASNLQITSNGAGYLATIELGTPAQSLSLILDTGSPLTWVADTNITAFTPSGDSSGESTSAMRKEICSSNGCFDPADSSTFSSAPAEVFAIQYVDTSEAIGEITSDTAVFAGLSMTDFEFGLVTYQYNPTTAGAIAGIIGLGPQTSLTGYPSIADATGPAANTTAEAFNGPTLLDQFVASGILTSDAYSLYLNAKGNGTLLLGGVDAAKYSGPLTVLPIIDTQDQTLQVQLLSVGFNSSTSSSDTATLADTVAVLDSGTTEVYLPTAAVTLVASKLGCSVVDDQPLCKCSAITAGTTVDFHFQNGAVIRTPAELLVDYIYTQRGTQYCRLGLIGIGESSYYLLGDYFLRSAYVVYNWGESQIALAQVKYTDSTNITEIGTGTFGIPNAVYNSSSGNISGSASVATVSGVSQPWSADSSTGNTGGSSTSSSESKQGFSVSLGLICAAFVGAALM